MFLNFNSQTNSVVESTTIGIKFEQYCWISENEYLSCFFLSPPLSCSLLIFFRAVEVVGEFADLRLDDFCNTLS